MELEENNIPEEQGDDAVEIYSKRAIFWFSVLASPLFGGVLLMLNLKAAGYKTAMYVVSAFTILYYFAANLLLAYLIDIYKIDLQAYQAKLMAYKGNTDIVDGKVVLLLAVGVAANIIGGLILSQYFFRKYFPEKDYYPKSIVSALLITIVVILLLRVFGLGGF
jgi:hypothetical protein